MEIKGVHKGIAIVISILVVTLLVGAVVNLLFVQLSDFLQEW
jgi:hypothetical protein